MKPQIMAVVFDRDGVLSQFDIKRGFAYLEPLLPFDLETLLGMWLSYGEQVGWPKTLEEEQIFIRRFWEQLSRTCLLNREIQQKLLAFNYLDYLILYPEVYSVLGHVRQQGYRLGVLSNFTLASLEPSLEALHLDVLIDAAFAATVGGVSKPDIRAYHRIAELLSVKPQECLYFDDDIEYVQGAINAGMTAYWVCRSDDTLNPSIPIIQTLNEVPKILQKLLSSTGRPK